jgi:hypothetical protein
MLHPTQRSGVSVWMRGEELPDISNKKLGKGFLLSLAKLALGFGLVQ